MRLLLCSNKYLQGITFQFLQYVIKNPSCKYYKEEKIKPLPFDIVYKNIYKNRILKMN